MQPHEVIYLTRAKFTDMFGVEPSADVMGVCITSPDGRAIVCEYIFTDKDEPIEGDKLDIAELERMFALSDGHPFENEGACSGRCKECLCNASDHGEVKLNSGEVIPIVGGKIAPDHREVKFIPENFLRRHGLERT